MRAFSVRQPRAELLVSGQQPCALLLSRRDKDLLGQRLAVHASSKLGRDEREERVELERRGATLPAAHLLPRGVVVGSVRLLGFYNSFSQAGLSCIRETAEAFETAIASEAFQGFYHRTHWAWVFGDPRRAKPVAARGKGGIWKFWGSLEPIVAGASTEVEGL